MLGRWTEVRVPAKIPEKSSVQLEITAVDADGNRVGYLSAPADCEPGEHMLVGLMKMGRLNGEVSVRIDQQSEIRGIPKKVDWLNEPLKPSSKLIVTVGEPKGFDFTADLPKSELVVKVVSANAKDLSVNSLAYDGVSSLVIAGHHEFSPAQLMALRDWVGSGGRLVISLPQESAAARESIRPFADWLPVTIAEQPVVVREFGALETFAGKSIRIPLTSTLEIPSLHIEAGETLAASRSEALLVRAPYGMGSVTVLAVDLTAKPLSDWKALSRFCAKLSGVEMTEASEKAANKSAQLSSTGISDLATQLHAIQENFERVNRASPWFVMGMLLLLLIVVGPLDYFFVHRLLKKPHLTWISYPIFVATLALLANWLGTSSNGSSRHLNELDIINIDVATSTARTKHFVTLYSPNTSQTALNVQATSLIESAKIPSQVRVSWHGIPETVFGGMIREMGIELGAKYQQQSDGQLSQLPIMQWSSKSLIADGIQSVEGLIDCDLKATPTGRLTGTITHRLPVPIEDWMIVYKTTVYRQLKRKDDPESLSFPPKQVWRVEQPNVYSREIRPYLTGIITMAKSRTGDPEKTDYGQIQTNYDQLSLEPASLIRILTFHDEVGAERYTGLTNQVLDDEDLSHLLKLGRAILFGRISQSAATIQQDGSAVEPDRQTCFVRLILPVARASEVIKDLRRLVPAE